MSNKHIQPSTRWKKQDNPRAVIHHNRRLIAEKKKLPTTPHASLQATT